MSGRFSITFGALAPSISQQLREQGLSAPGKLSQWQKDADAIARLAVRGILPDAQATTARRRLLKRIYRECKPMEKP